MIYTNQYKDILTTFALINFLTFASVFSVRMHIVVVCLFFLIEIGVFLIVSRKLKNNIWLRENGKIHNINKQDVEVEYKITKSRTGSIVDIKLHTKNQYKYKGNISIPYSCLSAFKAAFDEIDMIEIRIDPAKNDNYYMCVEKIAALRWIPNIIVEEKRSVIYFWIFINICIMLGTLGCSIWVQL